MSEQSGNHEMTNEDGTFKVPDTTLARFTLNHLLAAFRALNERDPKPDDIAYYAPYMPLIHVSSRDCWGLMGKPPELE